MRHLFTVVVLAALLAATAPRPRGQEGARPNAPAARGKAAVVFAEVEPAQSKLVWSHDNGRSEAHHLPETCGGGGIFFDYDGDGWLDIYLVNSGPSDFFKPAAPLKNALYRNNRDGTFTDVT